MNPETVNEAIETLRESWPQQHLSERAEEGWRFVFRDSQDSDLAFQVLLQLSAYRKGRPMPAEFGELYRAKSRHRQDQTPREPWPELAPDFSERIEQLREIVRRSQRLAHR